MPAAGSSGYTTSRPFPADPAQPLALAFDWRSAADYREIDVSAQLGAEGSVTGALPLVRSRDIRVEVAALGRNDLAYFAAQSAGLGDAAADEIGLRRAAARTKRHIGLALSQI